MTMKNHSQKIHIAVLFGGKSAEHEVSVQSARNVVKALDKTKYDLTLIGIDKTGVWLPFSPTQLATDSQVRLSARQKSNISITPFTDNATLLIKEKNTTKPIDVVFPILHGPFGEDGTIQGLLKLANIPYVGAGVLGSAVGMDKDVMKRLLRDAGLPIARFLVFKKNELAAISFSAVKQALGLPFFVKPANLGSSVGVTKVHDETEFKGALASAFTYDNKLLIEQYIIGKEIECSVLGNSQPVASVCGEIASPHEFYSYEAKYLDETSTSSLTIPASIPNHVSAQVQDLAIKAFKVLCCEGMARVDCFVTQDEAVLINEINTIPGFTSVSMYPKLWEASGLSYTKLIDKLIKLALDRFDKEQELRTALPE